MAADTTGNSRTHAVRPSRVIKMATTNENCLSPAAYCRCGGTTFTLHKSEVKFHVQCANPDCGYVWDLFTGNLSPSLSGTYDFPQQPTKYDPVKGQRRGDEKNE